MGDSTDDHSARAAMILDDQAETIRFLSQPASYGVASVDRIETHASIVFLAGERAYKLKRAVRYDYLDFSSVELRRRACDAELALNRRTAPDIYLSTRPVTRAAGGALAIGGSGEAIDWLIEMVRFDQEALLDRLAARNDLDLDLMLPLGTSIARLHADAQRHPDHGGSAGMKWVIDGNEAGFNEHGSRVFDSTECARLTATARQIMLQQAALLDHRRLNGFVRQCHGDLHLRNIFLWQGAPTLFDAVEFNDGIACIDVMYDLAFLVMDLWRRHLRVHANTVFNAYVSETHDIGALPVLPLFLSCRAAVRAKTTATSSKLQTDEDRTRSLHVAARDYITLASVLLSPSAARIVAIGGPSGSGKSTLARKLASQIGAAPGAIVIRSDVERKRMSGVSSATPLAAERYAEAVSRDVYQRIIERAVEIARTGHSAIVDAVFGDPSQRKALAEAAHAANVEFKGVWLHASAAVMGDRLRRRVGDASDATYEVMQAQLAKGFGPIEWPRVDSSGGEDETLRLVEEKM